MKNNKNMLRIVLSSIALVALCGFGSPSCTGIGTSPSADDEPDSIVCGIGTSPSGPCKKADGGVIVVTPKSGVIVVKP